MELKLIPSGLKKRYAREFPDRDLHHIKPRSRKGLSTQFNLYPYHKKVAHPAFHTLFSNMNIFEIWDVLEEVYFDIFESGRKTVNMWWLESCLLEVGNMKDKTAFERKIRDKMEEEVEVAYLAHKWENAFGCESLGAGRRILKEMMLYMIFGINMLDENVIFNKDNLVAFLELSPTTGERLRAFQICFGRKGCSIHAMKVRISRIIYKN